MCFYNDYEWYADIYEPTEGPAEEACTCHECGEDIVAGQWRKHIFMQQHEECVTCAEGIAFDDDGEEIGHDPDTCNHNYGEVEEYVCCEPCDKVLRSIKAAEKEAGCPIDAQQPALGCLWDELQDHDDLEDYLVRALKDFPELAGHPPITRVMGMRSEA